MTYEEYLDEVTTLIVELYELSDDAAIKLVVRAQSEGYFIEHDDVAAMRTQSRAKLDAKTLFEKHKPAASTKPKTAAKPVKPAKPKR
ncbi:hypothetical protein [Chitinimonas arctica]|uniref:hypothetical protein n=1 Tax=Chitinimonas arctica TaxID=2594795 RepID=UPI001CC62EE2|nr:hypothetical protein [Chitinimonas arctica]